MARREGAGGEVEEEGGGMGHERMAEGRMREEGGARGGARGAAVSPPGRGPGPADA